MPASAIARHVVARHGRDYLRMLASELERVEHAQGSQHWEDGARCVSISVPLAHEIAEGLRVEADALDRFCEEGERCSGQHSTG